MAQGVSPTLHTVKCLSWKVQMKPQDGDVRSHWCALMQCHVPSAHVHSCGSEGIVVVGWGRRMKWLPQEARSPRDCSETSLSRGQLCLQKGFSFLYVKMEKSWTRTLLLCPASALGYACPPCFSGAGTPCFAVLLSSPKGPNTFRVSYTSAKLKEGAK